MTSQLLKDGVWKIPALAVSVVPKFACSVCAAGYSAVLSSLGVTFLLTAPYAFPLTAVLLAVAVGSMGVGSPRRTWGPLVMAIVASGLILPGKFAFESNVLVYFGLGLLVVASVWNWVARRRMNNFCECLPQKTVLVNEGIEED